MKRILASSVVTLAVSVLLSCAGGDGPPRPDPGAEDAERLERLRSLPYVGTVEDDPHPGHGVVLHDPARSAPGYNLYTIQNLSRAELIDAGGAVVRSWSHAPPGRWERAELLPGGDLLVVGADPPARTVPAESIPDESRYVLRLGWDGRVIWKRALLAHHDIEQTPDGRLLVLTLRRLRLPRVHPEVDTRDDQLTFLDQDGRVLESVSLLEAFTRRPELVPLRELRINTLGVEPWVDLFHGNSIETIDRPDLTGRHPIFEPGNVLVSLRHLDRVVVLNVPRREPVWAWGEGELLGPHDARLLGNGNILVFDNGVGRGWSRIVELDPVAGRIVWEYRASPPEDFFSLRRGSSQRLPNGNTLICSSDQGRAFEVTPQGRIVWDFLTPHRIEGRRAALVRMVRYPPAWIEAIRAGEPAG